MKPEVDDVGFSGMALAEIGEPQGHERRAFSCYSRKVAEEH